MAKKILIIEDYPATSEMIASILEAEGFKPVVAVDGPSGLEQARSQKPDLILLDIMMPEMSGFEVCEKLKADKKTAKIPIIIVSVRATEESIKKGKELGADEYVLKPFDPFELVTRVKVLLEKKG
ncbi:response regulator transcription factor [Candidatus Margulisiibacteriota bacterium]